MTSSATWHRLSEVDHECRTALCAICGPTTIRIRSNGGSECMTSRRANRGKGGEISPEAARRYHLRRRYKLTDEAIARIMATGTACAICLRTDRKLHVDHNHACCPGRVSCGRCVRGFLCLRCNQGLARFEDDHLALARAADYLSRRG